MIYDQREALRYMGADPDDREAGMLADQVFLRLRNIVQPRSLIRRFPCLVEEDGVRVANIKFHSRNLARHLQGCRELLLMAATLGLGLDREIKIMTLKSLTWGSAAQGVAAAMIENYCNQILAAYDTVPLKQRVRFSPGYGDWNLAEQELFFRIMDVRSIGLTLTASGMMAPVKSVTAVVGLGPAVTTEPHSCRDCNLQKCAFRTE